jgi:hypothetical protein
MTDQNEEEARCANEGCQRAAEPDSIYCSSCGLEWSLFHRETREEPRPRAGQPESGVEAACA